MLRERDVALLSLTDHIDAGTAAGRMLYAVLGAVAQFEREVLRKRTIAGMRAAKRRGEHIGRRPALSTAQVRESRELVKTGKSPTHVARIVRVGRSTLYRALECFPFARLTRRHRAVVRAEELFGSAAPPSARKRIGDQSSRSGLRPVNQAWTTGDASRDPSARATT